MSVATPTLTAASSAAESTAASPTDRALEPVAATFRDMRLKVGDFLPFESRHSGSRTGGSVQVLGWLDGSSLIVSMPCDRAGRIPVEVGDPVTLRAFTGKSAFAFKSVVLRLAYQPFAYLHLRFPDKVDAVVVRSSFRHRMQLPATITAPGMEQCAATILNIGTSGALVGLDRPLPTESTRIRIATQFELHGVPVSLDVSASIRSSAVRDDEGDRVGHQHGVEFEGLSANDRLILGSLLWYEMHERPSESV